MRNIIRSVAVLSLIILTDCSGRHLITDQVYRSKVDSAFAEAMKMSPAISRDYSMFSNTILNLRQDEAMKFLYAYMPLNDIATLSPDFFLLCVNESFRSINDAPWGKSIPEDIFLHYVLPVRVNNENLDSFRIKYYDEIKSRIEGKNITEAALEINHWCHEKVTYQGSDSRTSAPESTILSARGRCGEESTFTVAALRTAGIPARQVYTPRWAHCDDNHAWVEFWNNGHWSYMGACEPEPVADLGWFTEPARRAMLVNSRSFGAPSGNENIVTTSSKFSIVNCLSKYAVTKRIFVKVVDASGKPEKDAQVEFQLYNYAEFFPLATIPTGADGICSFETGLGDLLIWGRKDNEFDFRKISVNETDTVLLSLGKKITDATIMDLDLSVPIKRTPFPVVSAEVGEANNRRLDEENAIRTKYISSWVNPVETRILAQSFAPDTSKVADIISRSMGNYGEIIKFLKSAPDSLKHLAVDLLTVIADKDLRDTRSEVLMDHLRNCVKPASSNLLQGNYKDYVLNPRISDELITPWRGYLRKTIPDMISGIATKDPSVIVNYIDSIVKINDDLNYAKTLIAPEGVMKLGLSDSRSRAVCFVAAERSLGIPARLEPGSNLPQYFSDGLWYDVYFSGQQKASVKRGFIKLLTNDKNPVPRYYKHFTLARLENGRYNTLEYEEDKAVDLFSELTVIPGQYMLVTGNRLDDSRILSSISFFTISEGEHRELTVRLRTEKTSPQVLGNINLTKILTGIDDEMDKFKSMAGRQAVLVWLESDKEPSRHVINDFIAIDKELELKGCAFVFFNVGGTSLTPDEKARLPYNSLYSDDSNLEVLRSNIKSGIAGGDLFPIVLYVNKNGEILYKSEGYHIGTGEEILKFLNSPE